MYCIEQNTGIVKCLPIPAMTSRLEDRIKGLCAKAVALPDSDELNQVLAELKSALSEHTERIRKMAVEIVPNRRTP